MYASCLIKSSKPNIILFDDRYYIYCQGVGSTNFGGLSIHPPQKALTPTAVSYQLMRLAFAALTRASFETMPCPPIPSLTRMPYGFTARPFSPLQTRTPHGVSGSKNNPRPDEIKFQKICKLGTNCAHLCIKPSQTCLGEKEIFVTSMVHLKKNLIFVSLICHHLWA